MAQENQFLEVKHISSLSCTQWIYTHRVLNLIYLHGDTLFQPLSHNMVDHICNHLHIYLFHFYISIATISWWAWSSGNLGQLLLQWLKAKSRWACFYPLWCIVVCGLLMVMFAINVFSWHDINTPFLVLSCWKKIMIYFRVISPLAWFPSKKNNKKKNKHQCPNTYINLLYKYVYSTSQFLIEKITKRKISTSVQTHT